MCKITGTGNWGYRYDNTAKESCYFDGSLWLLAKEHKKIADGNVVYAVTMGEEIGCITSDHSFWA